MNQRKIKIPNEKTLDYIKSNRKMIEESSLPSNKDILKLFGIESEKNIEANDYFQFVKYFGNNVELYKSLKPLKDEAEVSWQDIKNIKWQDVNLENQTITIKK